MAGGRVGLRAVLVLAVTAGLTLGAVGGSAPVGLAEPAPPAPPPGAAPQDARNAQGGPQRWKPPIAGSTVRVEISDGTARLSPAREGRGSRNSMRGAQRQGFLHLGAHQFGTPVNRIDVPVTADVPAGSGVAVDVRGQRADGQWTEWTPAAPGAPAVLDEPTRTVAVRLALLAPPGAAGPTVRAVEVLADRVATGPRVLTPRARHRVFATREGLVGGITANGHRIVPNDQFAALPSRRSLSPNGSGDYSVKVCTDAGRCATVPVWDIGPWNTEDDYWNPPAQRERFKDLPQGLPQAQAAYEDGHNGGRDGSGRIVRNPAGIDLADGTFWGLGLKANAFVTVEYLWTARSNTLGRAVSPEGPVLMRSAPRADAPEVGFVGDQAQVEVACQAVGDAQTGSQGTSNLWLQVAPGRFAPAAWIAGTPPVPACAPPAPAGAGPAGAGPGAAAAGR